MEGSARVFVAGHQGLLGRALLRRLQAAGHRTLILASHEELDLRQKEATHEFFRREHPDFVFLAAARVGGIVANQKRPVSFLASNLAIESNVLAASHEVGALGLCLFGSSCMYPREARQPIREEDLETGPLEPTSRAYAISKLAGLELCRAYRSQFGRRFFTMVPATLYGPHDHFHSERAHVVPALMSRVCEARAQGLAQVTILGSGRVLREFLFCDDAAEAALFLMDRGEELDLVNSGSGEEVTIAELAQRIARVVGYRGEIRFDPDAPEGAPRKFLDSSKIRAMGWKPRVSLDQGLEITYRWYRDRSGPSQSR